LGPASSSETVIKKMAVAGMDVARINFSHGSPEEHEERIYNVRNVNKKYGFRLKILQDLEGRRIRTGALKNKSQVMLVKGKTLRVTNRQMGGDAKTVSIDYPGPLTDIKKGSRVFIDDGNLALLVKSSGKNLMLTEVLAGGELKEHKGVNVPDSTLRFRGMSEKDRINIAFGVAHGVDFIAQSFVVTHYDILEIREMIKGALPDCGIIAKIENRDGIRNLGAIMKTSDGIMVARGDMGVSLPIYEVPIMQKKIIRKCNTAGKFVITATQMLESMIHNRMPTRAEVSDVANAILDGTDYVMLSAETAVGENPVETVAMMDSIIRYTERFSRSALL
jgi:pyruvate kinase